MTLPDPQPSVPPPDPGASGPPGPVMPPPPPAAPPPPAEAGGPPPPPPGFAPFPVWLVPAYAAQPGSGAAPMSWPMAPPAAAPPPPPAPAPADPSIAHNQRLMILAIVSAVLVIHLPWLLYLLAVQGCWGSFIDLCFTPASAPPGEDPFAEATATPFLFARVAFFMLRVQAVLSSDWAQMSQALQVSTGLGSFMLTKIIAAQGRIAEGSRARFLLAGTCAAAFVILFWAEIHLTGSSRHAELGDLTVLAYIDQELPADFLTAGAAKAGLMQYLQILRLADALLLGAALAMPKSSGKAA